MKKIGFIAMSGVRAHNAELTQVGLTLPGFVERNKVIASLPSLSLLTLAGLTPRKFKVEYREIADLKQEGPLPEDYDLVAISSFSAQMFDGYQVADPGGALLIVGQPPGHQPDVFGHTVFGVVEAGGEPAGGGEVGVDHHAQQPALALHHDVGQIRLQPRRGGAGSVARQQGEPADPLADGG